jgi:transcriptional regulator with XRE-family HTH domain
MLPAYLNTLKTQGNFTLETISNLSGIPESTVKNILSGKTEDPRFETVSAIVKAMGGSLDAIYSAVKKEDVEANSVIILKETYEQRIKEIKEYYEQRISDLKEHYEVRITDKKEHINTIQLDKRWFRIATCICAFALVVLFIVEILTPGMGWFRY